MGILYENWFGFEADELRMPDMPFYPDENGINHYRCWGVPAVGKYSSNNATVANIHADQMAKAGIDYIAIDYSNRNIMDQGLNSPLVGFLQLWSQRHAAGKPTPRVTFLIPPTEAGLSKLWGYYSNTTNISQDVFFHYDDGRPLLMTDGNCNVTESPSCVHFNAKNTGALQGPTMPAKYWSFMDLYPQPAFYFNGKPEQMAVNAAQQETWMSETTAHCRNYNYRTKRNDGYLGQNLDDQFARARDLKVRTVFVKSWNEWCSIRGGNSSMTGNGRYTDEFNSTCSNDIEPMTGGFGDAALVNLTRNIAEFKKQGMESFTV